MADTRLKDLVKGHPFSLSVRNDAPGIVDFEAAPVYLFFESESGRSIRFTYVPNQGGNDGTYSLVSGVQRITFQKPAEWTRVAENLPVGLYSVWPWVGPLTGQTPLVEDEGSALLCVKLPESGLPMGSES